MKMKCHLLLSGALIFLSSLFLGCDFGFVSAEVVSEKSVLLEFKQSVSDPYGILSSWDVKDSDYCSWYGISCDSNFKVSSLNISGVTGFGGSYQTSSSPYFSRIQYHRFGNGRICSRGAAKLVGGLPSIIGKLTELRVVSLPCNDLRGEIPSEIFGLEKLIVLDLEGNSLTGRLPDRFDGLRKLRVWNLALNWIYGEIPFSISKCVDLEVLNLAANRLNGSVPSFLGNFPKLKRLFLSQNRLSGYFPAGFSLSCSSLEYLDLSGNFLAGSIPSWLGKCKHLKELLLFSNKLKGAIPNELGQLQMLEVLDVSRNSLTGLIPVDLRQCLKLSVLVISNLFNPYTYHNSVEHNYFEGSIPEAVASLPKLRIVWAPRANLEGELPSKWGDCENMEMLNLAQNRLRGEIFNVFRQCKKLDYLDLSSNKISGKLDEELHQERLVNVSFDKFTSHIPMALHTICRSLRFLNVSNNQIFGSIPPGLGSWKSLVVLDWSRNMIEGHIPPEVGLLKHLKYLSLAGNNLTGEIPSSFTWLSSLQVLDLSSNEIYGEIPQGLVHLTKLRALLLNNNKLSGKIPSGLFRPTLSSFNVSFTNLSGSSLSKNDSIDLTCVLGKHCFLYPHFVSLAASSEDVLNVSGNSGTNRSAVSESVSATPNNGLNSIEIAAIVSASVVVSVFLALLILFFYTRKRVPHSRVQVSESREITVFIDIGAPLTFEAIVKATGNFSNANCIGNGGFGATYRAEIHPGTSIAVKKLSVGRCHGIQQFDAEIKILEKLRHPNLVTLIGYHAGDSEMLLIYNYLPGGNLEKFIKDRSAKAVDWKILHKIAFDIAKALAYLHDQCAPRVLHRDVKPSNILLDNELNAYLSDFGLSRLLGTSESHATTGVAGTFGYVAPEYALTCRLSEKADVYSYGVVLLELISDKRALDPSFSSHVNGFNIVSWARMQLGLGRAKEVFTVGLWDSTPHNDLVLMLHLAITCTDETLSTRPTMKQVLRRLKQIQPLAQ